MAESKPINGFMLRKTLADRLDREIDNLEALLYLPEDEWSDEVINLKNHLASPHFALMGADIDREYLADFFISRKAGWSMAKMKKYRLPKKKGKNEIRNEEIVIWCEIYRSKGMTWDKAKAGGVYYEVAKLFDLHGTTIEDIYRNHKNISN